MKKKARKFNMANSELSFNEDSCINNGLSICDITHWFVNAVLKPCVYIYYVAILFFWSQKYKQTCFCNQWSRHLLVSKRNAGLKHLIHFS